MSAPASARPTANATPSPDDAPVTIATFPASDNEYEDAALIGRADYNHSPTTKAALSPKQWPQPNPTASALSAAAAPALAGASSSGGPAHQCDWRTAPAGRDPLALTSGSSRHPDPGVHPNSGRPQRRPARWRICPAHQAPRAGTRRFACSRRPRREVILWWVGFEGGTGSFPRRVRRRRLSPTTDRRRARTGAIARDASKLMLSAIGERDLRASDQVVDGARARTSPGPASAMIRRRC